MTRSIPPAAAYAARASQSLGTDAPWYAQDMSLHELERTVSVINQALRASR